MPGEDGNGVAAGTSDVDVVALYEQIQQELRGVAGQEADAAPNATRRAELRLSAERWWSVSAERPIPRRHGPLGAPIVLVKKVLKRLMRWYVDPLAHDQRTFNDAALKLVDDISRDLDWTRERALAVGDALIALQERYEDSRRRERELEERLLRLERRPAGAGAQTVAAQPAQANVPDYFAFESVMRGSTEEIRERQRVYVDDLRAHQPGVRQPVTITWQASPGKKWEGTVERKPTSIQTLGSRQVGEVLCTIANPGRELIPGTNVDAEIRTAVVNNALVIPRETLRHDAGGDFVFRLNNDVVERRPVRIGASSVSMVEVVSGLADGDAVAVPGDVPLKAGDRVTPIL